jgi:glutaconate CoA-transferase subunit B
VDIGFLGAAQVDRFANINTTVIGGTYERPRVRLPGAGGAPEIASCAKEAWIIVRQSQRTFVERLDFTTSSPASNGRLRRSPATVITDLGIYVCDAETHELTLTALNSGVTLDQVRQATAWELKVSPRLERTPEPTRDELAALRDLYARTAAAHGAAVESE